MTKRENDVLQLILKGKRNSEICRELGLAPGTVKTHLQNLFKEFGVRTRLELALKAVERGRQPVVTRRVIMGVQV
jgi:DNA-binding CsgD family transcriptional regulator